MASEGTGWVPQSQEPVEEPERFRVPEGIYERRYNPVTQKVEAVFSEVGKKWIEGKSLIERIIEREKQEERAELAAEIERQIKRIQK